MAMETVDDSEGSKSSEFPAGMRILLVDDCAASLSIIKLMLTTCNYNVTPCLHAKEALTLLREQKGEFDLVITDVHMPEMDGFQLLQAIYPEMDIPVILLSSDLRTEIIIKAIKDGACDYIVKPSSIEQYKNIWQHVYRKQLASRNNKEETDSEEATSKIKTRAKWTPELHQKFTFVVGQLGLDKATPKGIMELMNDPNLTKEQIASHLQKFREFIRKNGPQVSRISQQMLCHGGWNAAQNNPTIQQNPQFQIQESFKASNLQPYSQYLPGRSQSSNFQVAFQPQELTNTQFLLDQPQSSNFQVAFQPKELANTQFLLDQPQSSNFQVAFQPKELANTQFLLDQPQSSNFQVAFQPQNMANTQFLPDQARSSNFQVAIQHQEPANIQSQSSNFQVALQPQNVANTQFLPDQARSSNFQVAIQHQEPANFQSQSSNFQVTFQPQELVITQFLPDQPQSSNFQVAFQPQKVAYTQFLSDQAQSSNFQVAFQPQEPANTQSQSSNFEVALQPQELENAHFLSDQPQSSNFHVAFQSQEVANTQSKSSNFQVAFQPQELATNYQPVHNYRMEHNASPMSLAQNNPIPVPQNPDNMGQMQMQEQGFTNADMMQNYSVNGAYISPGALAMVHNENNSSIQENVGNQYFVGEGTCMNNATDRVGSENMGTKAFVSSILNSTSEDQEPDFDRYNKVWN